MKNKKYFVLILIILIIATVLCSCAQPSTELYKICFIGNNSVTVPPIGEFRLASARNDRYSQILEILPQDKVDFIKFMQQSNLYIGNFTLSKNNYYLSDKNKCKAFNGDDDCMWFAGKDYIWLGKFYANKFYYLTYIPMLTLTSNDISIEVTEVLFTDDITPKDIDVEYDCSLTWEQLKLIYHERKIDEQNYSIELNCFIFYKEDRPDDFYGSTLLYFNKDNNTVRISNDYTKIELTEEEIWQLFG